MFYTNSPLRRCRSALPPVQTAPMSGEHEHHHSLRDRLRHALTPHSHDSAVAVDSALETSDRGTRALLISFAVLGAPAARRAVVAVAPGSAPPRADPPPTPAAPPPPPPLAPPFGRARRPPNRRYTYGYGRAEDLAGIVIVVL